MMYDFEALVTEVLRNKPDLSRESLMELVLQKKKTVGSGYLTDQGALFLIAGELGVRLQHMVSSDLTLKDIQAGANDITVVARVLAIYPISEFKKKDGSGIGRYRRVSLFDGNETSRLTIWEDNVEAMKLSGIEVDTPVRVVSAYVKQSPDGRQTLNLGKRGKIEVIVDTPLASKIAPLSSVTKTLDQVKEGESVAAVKGLVVSDSRRSTFVRRDDGSSGSLTQFELKGPGTVQIRVVVWDGAGLPEIKSGSEVVVTNLRQKKGRQGEAELHGDVGTMVCEREQAPRLVKVTEVIKHLATGSVNLEVMALSKGSVREVSLKDGSTGKKGEVVLGDDTGEITTVAWDEASKMIEGINAGEKLRVHNAMIQVSKMGVGTLELKNSSKVERI